MTLKVKKRTPWEWAVLFLLVALIGVRSTAVMYTAQAFFLLVALVENKLEFHGIQRFYVASAVGFVLFSTASLLWSASFTQYRSAILSIVQIFLLSIVLMSTANSPKRIDYLFDCMYFVAWSMLIYIIIKTPAADWRDMIFGSYSLSTDAGRLGPTIGMHPNACGNNLSILIVFSTARFSQDKKWKNAVQLVLLAVCLMFTKSRASMALCCLGIFIFIALYKKLTYKQIAVIAGAVLCLILVVYLSLTNEILYQLYGRRMESLLYFFERSPSTTDASVLGRMRLQELAINVFKAHPIIGVGINNFRSYNNLSSLSGYYAHNNYLELLADLGIVGTLIYYSPFIGCLVEISRRLLHGKISNQERPKIAILLAILGMRFVGDFGQISYLNDVTQMMQAMTFSYLWLTESTGNKELKKRCIL